MEIETGVAVNIEDEMRQSYMDYAMSVIIGRALPDIRDGLKPVQRRVLYAMLKEGLVSTRKTSKCAGVVGEVLKKYHPHGDSSVYDALVRLAQPWCLRYPLVDGQGNFGSIDGDPAAAYRYTECRMTAVAESLLEDIELETVDFTANFDDSTEEPVVLPSLWPNLLVNGADGIAVGMATHIPPHNLTEVINGTVALIKNPDISLEELMFHIPGPDFPTGGIITGRGAIRQAYGTGRGIVRITALSHIETLAKKTRELQAIVVTEIPFQVNKARLIEKIASLVQEKAIEGISGIRDESDRKGMRIVIELKRDATAEVVLNQLHKLTPMKSSFGVINLAIVEGKPVICSLAEMLSYFVDHRRDVISRRTQFLLKKAEKRMHILEGFRIALLNLDEVIETIKKSQTPNEAKDNLSFKYSLSEIQSQAILELRLQKLTGMERLAIEQEHQELAEEIARLMSILADSKKIDGIIVDELEQAKAKYGDTRRTKIEDSNDEDIDVEDLIEKEDMVVTVSHKGYAKRIPSSTYKAQNRGGKGIAGTSSQEDDFVEHLYVASTHDYLLVFTSLGRLYWIKVYQIPEASRTARGRALVNLLELKDDEKVTTILPISEFSENKFLVFITAQGLIKKTDLSEYNRPRKGGIVACTLNEGDQLVGVDMVSAGDEILCASKTGLAIRFSDDNARPMGRSAKGVIAMRLDPDDQVVGMTVAKPEETRTFLSVCENGYGKRTKLTEYRAQNRGGKGVIDIQTESRNGPVVGVATVDDNSNIILITSGGKIIVLRAQDISIIGRNTKGVRLVNLEPEEKVLAISLLVADAEPEA